MKRILGYLSAMALVFGSSLHAIANEEASQYGNLIPASDYIGVDFAKVVSNCGSTDARLQHRSIGVLIWLHSGAGFDGELSEICSEVLIDVMRKVGDDKFADALSEAPLEYQRDILSTFNGYLGFEAGDEASDLEVGIVTANIKKFKAEFPKTATVLKVRWLPGRRAP